MDAHGANPPDPHWFLLPPALCARAWDLCSSSATSSNLLPANPTWQLEHTAAVLQTFLACLACWHHHKNGGMRLGRSPRARPVLLTDLLGNIHGSNWICTTSKWVSNHQQVVVEELYGRAIGDWSSCTRWSTALGVRDLNC